MDGFLGIDRRIDRLCARASSPSADAALRAEMEDLLEEGYVVALGADARVRRMRERLEELSGDAHRRHAVDEAWRIMRDKRRVEEGARRLRARLASMRSLAARTSSS
jgi:hypothetical protein